MTDCRTCGFWDDERYGCTCPVSDKRYACPLENKKPENVKALEEYADWISSEQAEGKQRASRKGRAKSPQKREVIMSDKVNHPDHYNRPGKRECIEEMRDRYGDMTTAIFCLTNAFKYLYRAGEKPGESAEEDIQKARWYFDYQKDIACGVAFEKLRKDIEEALHDKS